MTSEEAIAKIDKIVTKLKATNTVAYKTWLTNVNSGKYTDVSSTNWQQAFTELRAIRDGLSKPTPTPTPTPTATTKGLGALSYRDDPTPIIPDASIYDYVITAYGGQHLPGAKKEFEYVSCISVNSSWWAGVDVNVAKNGGMLLKDVNGNYMLNRGYPDNFIGDPAMTAYQDEWAKEVISHAQSWGTKAIYCDDCVATPLGLMSGYPAKYPTAASWRTAMLAFFTAVYPKLKAAGIELVVNAGGYIEGDMLSLGGYTDKALWQLIINHVDGLNTEYFLQAPPNLQMYYDAPTIDAWMGNWKSWLDLIDIAQNAGKAFHGQGVYNTEQAKRFARGSFLLRWNGLRGGLTVIQGGYVNDGVNPASPGWMNAPGLPNGLATQVGVGWKVAYTKQMIYVNPSHSSVANIDGHAIAPQDALFVNV